MLNTETNFSQIESSSSDTPKILVVDDEVELERLIKQRFRKQIQARELDFVFVHNGIEAIQYLRNQKQIDIVLTDINMPEMDGLTLLDLLPELNPSLKAVVISAYSDLRNIRMAMNRGAFDFLIKPIDFQDLEITLKKTFQCVKKIKETEKQLQKARDKEILLREIHHRVKNNLHVVANLLDLQSDYVDDEKVLSLFNDSQNRIQSIALIHEQLYQSDNLREVNFQEYLHRLLCNLFSSHETTTKISATLEVAPIWLNLETAIPCGLLINEFVTNVFKHAFPNRATGEIQLHLTEDEDGWLHFQFSDNGIGLPPDFDWQQSSTLGLKLVRILAKQLKAKVKLESNEGTSFTLIFKQLKYQSRL